MAFNWNPFKRHNHPYEKEEDDKSYVDSSVQALNPNYQYFKDANTDIERIVSMHSVIEKEMGKQNIFANPIWQTALEGNRLVLPTVTNKVERINQYRSIARYTECDWCLDEICDDFIHEDDNGDFITMELPENLPNLNDTRKDILQNEFRKYIELFDIKNNGFNLVKKFLIEGELCWENVIKHDTPELGIVGVKFLPTEYYETLIDTKTNRSVGIYFDVQKYSKELKELLSNAYYGSSSQIFNSMINVHTMGFNKDECVVFLWPQVTYINSGDISEDGLIIYPLIEKTKQAYHQLALLQDAAVILRVTRAPERLLFNISTGKMTQNYADAYIKNFADYLKKKKVAKTPDANGETDIASVYNPVSMLESYIFGKSDGNDGTSIESVGSSASYDEIADIEYFLRRLMKQFKIPFTRYKTPENTMERDETISYEEYSFTRMIVRFQRRFAQGFKNGFITHLKLRDIWDKYDLKESDIDISFVKPVLFDLYQTQKLVETKMNIYKDIVDNDEMSKIAAMKKYLGWTDAEIEENFMSLVKEKQLTQLGDYWSSKLDELGPEGMWNKSPIPLKPEESEDEEGESDDSEKDDEDSDSGSSGDKKAETPTFGLS